MVVGCLGLCQGHEEYLGGDKQGIYTLVHNMYKEQAKRGQCYKDDCWVHAWTIAL